MSISSGFQSVFLPCNDGMSMFVNADSLSSSNPFLIAQPLEDPPTYNTHHAQRSNLVINCNSGSPFHHQDLLDRPSLMRTACNSSFPTHGRSGRSLTRTAPTDKRSNHKLIEKQRRKDMKTLFSRLRSLLPEESLRGKRAESDQVLGAVNYICHLQQKIEGVSRQRDRMKDNLYRKEQVSLVGMKLSKNKKSWSKHPRLQGSDGEFPTVKINCIGAAVKTSLNAFEGQIVYSDLLLALEDCRLEVVNATSSSINNTVFHTIYNKVSDVDNFNMNGLYDKLRRLTSDDRTSGPSKLATNVCCRTNEE